MKNIKKLLLLVIASFSMNSFAITGRNAQKLTLNFGGIIVANTAVNIAYADGQSKPEHAPDYIDSKKYPEFAKFVAKYRCSPEIEKLVQENHTKKTRIQGNVYKYDNIPFYNKGENFRRIVYADEITKAIKDNNLDHLSVPDKCVCHMYGSVWNVIVKEAEKEKNPSKISLIELQQLVKLVEENAYADIHDQNVFKTKGNILSIVDTGERPYACIANRNIIHQVFVDRPYGCPARQEFFSSANMTPEAIEWLEKKIKETNDPNPIETKPTISENINKIIHDSTFYKFCTLFRSPPPSLDREYSNYKNTKY